MIDFTNNYVVNNLNPDFDLSKYYHPDMTAIDWQTLMLNSRIDNEGLIKWNDKIQLYKWMKESDISGPPVVYYSNESHKVSDVLKTLDKDKTYVVKPTHLSLSRYVFKWKNNNVYQIHTPSMREWVIRGQSGNDDNSPVTIWPWVSSYERIDSLMKQAWNTLDDEDWPRYYAPPGVIIEEYAGDSDESRTEMHFLCIWGIIVAVSVTFVNHKVFGDDGFNLNIDDNQKILGIKRAGKTEGEGYLDCEMGYEEILPKWWKEAWDMCKPILDNSRPDQVRLDYMFHNDKVYLSEFTWNPGCDFKEKNKALSPQAYTLLSEGYKYRLGGERPRVKLNIG